eukprot:Gb_11213 [translate_table: standard]
MYCTIIVAFGRSSRNSERSFRDWRRVT